LEYFDRNALQLLRGKTESENMSTIPSFPSDANSAIYFEQYCDSVSLEKYCIRYSELISKTGARAEDSWGGIDESEMNKMAVFRHAVPEEINARIRQQQIHYPDIYKISTDISVPDESLNKIIQVYKNELQKNNLEYVIFGHIGDNHLHVNIIPKNSEEMKRAKSLSLHFAKKGAALDGSVSAEHGIGKLKKELIKIMYPTSALDQMRLIKRGFDPKELLGQGTLF
jgi:D-lactate dehydrogenase (cytochrome)